MAPKTQTAVQTNGAGVVRARLLTALHMGRLRPGDRVLSVRRLADMTGINHKTVHRAYTALAREGILEVRPGSGTFVSERRSDARGLPSTPGLLEVLDRVRSEAEKLGLSPVVLSRFLDIQLGLISKNGTGELLLPLRMARHNLERSLYHYDKHDNL